MNVVMFFCTSLQVDPLRAKTYGVKKALDSSGSPDKSEGSPELRDGQILPKNKRGAVDEWVAMEQQKQRAIEALTHQRKEEEKAAKKLYKYAYLAKQLQRALG